jgi:hypothetical protein
VEAPILARPVLDNRFRPYAAQRPRAVALRYPQYRQAPSYTGRQNVGRPPMPRMRPNLHPQICQPSDHLPYQLQPIAIGETFTKMAGTLEVTLSVVDVRDPPPTTPDDKPDTPNEELRCYTPDWVKPFCQQFRQNNAIPTSAPVVDQPGAGIWHPKPRHTTNVTRRNEAIHFGFQYYFYVHVKHNRPLTLDDPQLAHMPSDPVNNRRGKISQLAQSSMGPPMLWDGVQPIGDSYLRNLRGGQMSYIGNFGHIGLTFGGMSTKEFRFLTGQLVAQQIASHIIIHTGVIDVARYRQPMQICQDLLEGIRNLLAHGHVRFILLCTIPNVPEFAAGNDIRHKLVRLVNREIQFKLTITDQRLQIVNYEGLFTDYRGSNRQAVRRFFVEHNAQGNPDLLHLTAEANQALRQFITLYKQEFFPYRDLTLQWEYPEGLVAPFDPVAPEEFDLDDEEDVDLGDLFQ